MSCSLYAAEMACCSADVTSVLPVLSTPKSFTTSMIPGCRGGGDGGDGGGNGGCGAGGNGATAPPLTTSPALHVGPEQFSLG